eukprot:GEZU01030572.1.p1 GENE.GEZU01030572.1~~GEZU01030572.1.p1  ORF type:complete len:101 (-),score=5.68 GEZU01030572.1:22-324(-)
MKLVLVGSFIHSSTYRIFPLWIKIDLVRAVPSLLLHNSIREAPNVLVVVPLPLVLSVGVRRSQDLPSVLILVDHCQDHHGVVGDVGRFSQLPSIEKVQGL